MEQAHGTFSQKSNGKRDSGQKVKRLEKELEEERIKTALLDKMIEISDRELGISIRKKLIPELHEVFREKNK